MSTKRKRTTTRRPVKRRRKPGLLAALRTAIRDLLHRTGPPTGGGTPETKRRAPDPGQRRGRNGRYRDREDDWDDDDDQDVTDNAPEAPDRIGGR